MKLVGLEIKQGQFTSSDKKEISYNNLVLHTTSDVLEIVKDDDGKIKKWGIGAKVETHKVKNEEDVLKSVFGVTSVTEQFLNSLIGKAINIYYNMYGKIEKIEVVKA